MHTDQSDCSLNDDFHCPMYYIQVELIACGTLNISSHSYNHIHTHIKQKLLFVVTVATGNSLSYL